MKSVAQGRNLVFSGRSTSSNCLRSRWLSCLRQLVAGSSSVHAQTYKENVLHSFNGVDGAKPEGGLIMHAKGHLYGTTSRGRRFQRRNGAQAE